MDQLKLFGWHRDKAMFDEVIGISLLSSRTFRARRQVGSTWERASSTFRSMREAS